MNKTSKNQLQNIFVQLVKESTAMYGSLGKIYSRRNKEDEIIVDFIFYAIDVNTLLRNMINMVLEHKETIFDISIFDRISISSNQKFDHDYTYMAAKQLIVYWHKDIAVNVLALLGDTQAHSYHTKYYLHKHANLNLEKYFTFNDIILDYNMLCYIFNKVIKKIDSEEKYVERICDSCYCCYNTNIGCELCKDNYVEKKVYSSDTELERTEEDYNSDTESEKTDDNYSCCTESERTDDNYSCCTESERTDDDYSCCTESERTDDDYSCCTESDSSLNHSDNCSLKTDKCVICSLLRPKDTNIGHDDDTTTEEILRLTRLWKSGFACGGASTYEEFVKQMLLNNKIHDSDTEADISDDETFDSDIDSDSDIDFNYPSSDDEYEEKEDNIILSIANDGLYLKNVKEQTYLMIKIAAANGLSLEYANKDLLDQKICDIAFQDNIKAIMFIPEVFKTEHMIDTIVKQDPSLLIYFDNISFEKGIDIIEKTPNNIVYMKHQNSEMKRRAIQKNGFLIEVIEQTQELCDLAVTQNYLAIQYIAPIFQTYDLCKKVLKKDSSLYKYVTNNSKAITLYALKKNIIDVPQALLILGKPSKKIHIISVTKDKNNIKYIDFDAIHNISFYKTIVELNPYAILNISPDRYTYDLLKCAVERDGSVIKHILDNEFNMVGPLNLKDISELAVKQNGLNLQYINKYYHNEVITLAALKNNILSYPFVQIYSPLICEYIIRNLKISHAIEIMNSIDNNYYDMFATELVKYDGLLLKSVNSSSTLICHAAIMANPFSIKYVPTYNQNYNLLYKLGSLSTYALRYIEPNDIDIVIKLILVKPQYVKYINAKYISTYMYYIALKNDVSLLDFVISKGAIMDVAKYSDFDIYMLVAYPDILCSVIYSNVKLLKKIYYLILDSDFSPKLYATLLQDKENYKYIKYMNSKSIEHEIRVKIVQEKPQLIKYLTQDIGLASLALSLDINVIPYIEKKYLNDTNLKVSIDKHLKPFDIMAISNGNYNVMVKLYSRNVIVLEDGETNIVFKKYYELLQEIYNLSTSSNDILDIVYKNSIMGQSTTFIDGKMEIIKNNEKYTLIYHKDNKATKLYKISKEQLYF